LETRLKKSLGVDKGSPFKETSLHEKNWDHKVDAMPDQKFGHSIFVVEKDADLFHALDFLEENVS